MPTSSTTTAPRQRTLTAPAIVEGIGLFTAASVRATIKPAPADHGVVFRRVDVPDAPLIPARVENIVDKPRRTVLRAPGVNERQVTIETVEHCLAALSGMGVDNALIEIDGPELPIGDGSASCFVDAILEAGIETQEAPRRTLVITEPVTVRAATGQGKEEAVLVALPNDAPTLELFYDLDYRDSAPVIGRQVAAFTLRADALAGVVPRPTGALNGSAATTTMESSDDDFARRIAPARTYALLEEAQEMRRRGMFSHVSPKDMLVIGEDGPVDNEFRFDDEPVRPKLLDLLGDLTLVGRPIQGRIIASRSGHALNHRMALALIEQARTHDRAPPRRRPGHGPHAQPRRAGHPPPAAPPVPHGPGGPGAGDRRRPAGHRDQERDRERALLSGPLPRFADHARCPDR